MDTILDEWSIHKIYVLMKSFSLMLSTAALNNKNSALKQAGYRGFELPHAEIENEISQWFKTLRNKLKDKHSADGTNSILMVSEATK